MPITPKQTPPIFGSNLLLSIFGGQNVGKGPKVVPPQPTTQLPRKIHPADQYLSANQIYKSYTGERLNSRLPRPQPRTFSALPYHTPINQSTQSNQLWQGFESNHGYILINQKNKYIRYSNILKRNPTHHKIKDWLLKSPFALKLHNFGTQPLKECFEIFDRGLYEYFRDRNKSKDHFMLLGTKDFSFYPQHIPLFPIQNFTSYGEIYFYIPHQDSIAYKNRLVLFYSPREGFYVTSSSSYDVDRHARDYLINIKNHLRVIHLQFNEIEAIQSLHPLNQLPK